MLSRLRQIGENEKESRDKLFSVIFDSGSWPELKLTDNIEEVLRDLVLCQVDALQQRRSLVAAQDFMNSNPDDVFVRIVSHLQHIFDISHVEGLIPKMNQIYIFTNELTTFLKSIRSHLGVSQKDCSDSSLLIEIERIVSGLSTVP